MFIFSGLYPGDHDIIANHFIDPDAVGGRKYFVKENSESTGLPKWWQNYEPIWATASKAGLNFSTYLWSRCDVEWFDVHTEKPSFCENVYERDESKTLFFNMEIAMIHFQTGITDAAIVYEDSLLRVSTQHGPLSKEAEIQLRKLDMMIENLLSRMKQSRMDELVNFIILSDHGMSKVKHQISLNLQPVNHLVKWVVGDGAYVMIYPRTPRFTAEIVNILGTQLSSDDVKIYTEDQIPDDFQWKQSKYCPPILILARPGTGLVLVEGQQRNQWPVLFSIDKYKAGISGYDPKEPDMRGVFMARGPGMSSSLKAKARS